MSDKDPEKKIPVRPQTLFPPIPDNFPLDLRDAFWAIRQGGRSLHNTAAQNPQVLAMAQLSDSSSSDEEVSPSLRVTEEEKAGTVPGSKKATAIALGMRTAQANPTVPRGPMTKHEKRVFLHAQHRLRPETLGAPPTPPEDHAPEEKKKDQAEGGQQSVPKPKPAHKKKDKKKHKKSKSKKSSQ